MSKRLLYFSPATSGGLADYARAQAAALAQSGVEVEVLSSASFPIQADDPFTLRPDLSPPTQSRVRILNQVASVRRIVRDYGQLARVIREGAYEHILLGAYAEYMAPAWSGPLLRQARRGVVFGAVIHDPVRDYVVGPKWWHRRSIACAYSFLREAFVHEPITLETVRPMPNLRTTVIPHGPYAFPPASLTRDQFRRENGIPDGARVWLSFGHVRDGKNLDLVIRALAHFSAAFLVVAGKEQSGGQKPVSYYRELAQRIGVAERCLWLNRFIAPGEVGNVFGASDLVLLTYSKNFRSASGVLNVASSYRKPCIASSGQGNLQTMVTHYQLGTWVEPDQLDALIAGLNYAQTSPPAPRWDAFEADNSWQRNAQIVSDRMFALNPDQSL